MLLSEILQPLHEDMLAKWLKASHCLGAGGERSSGPGTAGATKRGSEVENNEAGKACPGTRVPSGPIERLLDKKKKTAHVGETEEKSNFTRAEIHSST